MQQDSIFSRGEEKNFGRQESPTGSFTLTMTGSNRSYLGVDAKKSSQNPPEKSR